MRGPQVMLGYWNRPEETEEIFHDGWLRTGDVAHMDHDGYFYVVDRRKDMIDASGFKVLPREVEEVLLMHPKVREAVVAGVPDAYRGETVKAFVVLRPGEASSEEEIVELLPPSPRRVQGPAQGRVPRASCRSRWSGSTSAASSSRRSRPRRSRQRDGGRPSVAPATSRASRTRSMCRTPFHDPRPPRPALRPRRRRFRPRAASPRNRRSASSRTTATSGSPAKKGAVVYDAEAGTYTVTGGGENMWFDKDAFHFVWKKAEGDVGLAADVRFAAAGGNNHKKAALLVRQGLEPDAAYADAVVHGDGLTSIQYREVRGGPTREVQSNAKGPKRLRIEKQGDYVFLSVAAVGEPLRSAGGSFKIRFTGPFLVGLGVCAHDDAASETAVFSNVELLAGVPPKGGEPVLESTLETIAIDSKDRRVVRTAAEHFEAPNWSRDGKELVYNSGGLLYRIPAAGGKPQRIDTGFATKCNNDHGLSPDGTQLAISDQSQGEGKSLSLRAAVGRREAAARHAARALLLARLVARREDARLLRGARRRVRRLHDSRRGRRGEAAHDGTRARRRPRLLARRRVDLLQLRAHRDDADLADAHRRERASSR